MSAAGTGPQFSLTKLGNTLLVAPHSALHDSAIVDMTDNLLGKLRQGEFHNLILDVSGIATVDSFMMRAVGELTRAARFLGVNVVLSGVRPDTALTLVELGVYFSGIPTALNLKEAMKILKEE
ncbi:MAG: STAS domain-containing protein [Thermoproteota archaeon]